MCTYYGIKKIVFARVAMVFHNFNYNKRALRRKKKDERDVFNWLPTFVLVCSGLKRHRDPKLTREGSKYCAISQLIKSTTAVAASSSVGLSDVFSALELFIIKLFLLLVECVEES